MDKPGQNAMGNAEGAAPLQQLTCSSCTDAVSNEGAARAPCGHIYCQSCIRQMFEVSLNNEALFPPRCCRGEIPLDAVSHVLTKAIADAYQLKKVEYSTENRTYCCVPTCSAFIPPEVITHGFRATCLNCGWPTCAKCKQSYHFNTDCPVNVATQQVMNIAAREGWRTCGRCNMLLERVDGCIHMTCRCGYQFCIRCGDKWPCGCIVDGLDIWAWDELIQDPFDFGFLNEDQARDN